MGGSWKRKIVTLVISVVLESYAYEPMNSIIVDQNNLIRVIFNKNV